MTWLTLIAPGVLKRQVNALSELTQHTNGALIISGGSGFRVDLG